MEEDLGLQGLYELTHPTQISLHSYSPLTLAYLGDSVYELVIRTLLLKDGNYPPGKLSKKSSSLVKATTQAQILESLMECLTPQEEGIFRRARNAHFGTKAKHASVMEYKKATGFEAIIGYLYLQKDMDRIYTLVGKGLQNIGEYRIGGYLV